MTSTTLRYGSSLVLALVMGLTACSSTTQGSSDANGDGTSSGGPAGVPTMTCTGACERCESIACGCKDGTMTAICACSSDICADASACGSLYSASEFCRDHGGVADSKSEDPADPKPDPGSSNPTKGPTRLTIRGSFDDVKPQHAGGASLVTLIAAPSFTPTTTSLPDLTKATVSSIVSPAKLGCSPKITFTLNRGQIGAQVMATDTGTSKSCATFVDKVAAGGLQATLTNAAYADGSLATVDVDLRP